MKTIEIILLTILYIHQTLDIVGVKGYVFRPKFKSADTIVWVIFTILMVLYYLQVPYISLFLILVLGLVFSGLYYFHWRVFFFGASEKRIQGYNNFFKGTHRIFPESETRLIPDTYHIIHSLLYLTTFIVMVINQLV